MTLLVWSPSSDLEWLAGCGCCTTRLRSYDAGVDIKKGFSNPWLWIYCEKANTDFLLFTASPTYALLTPSVVLAVSLNYMFEWATEYLRGAESSWDPSTREGEAYLYSLLEALRLPLYAYTALTDERYLSIEESKSPNHATPPRLLPQLLL